MSPQTIVVGITGASGAVIMPPVRAFYFAPKTFADIATQFACRVLEQLGLPQAAQSPWTGAAPKKGCPE